MNRFVVTFLITTILYTCLVVMSIVTTKFFLKFFQEFFATKKHRIFSDAVIISVSTFEYRSQYLQG